MDLTASGTPILPIFRLTSVPLDSVFTDEQRAIPGLRKHSGLVCVKRKDCLQRWCDHWLQGEVLPSAEICDSYDNDCDGFSDDDADTDVDAGTKNIYYVDSDGDGYGTLVTRKVPAHHGYVANATRL